MGKRSLKLTMLIVLFITCSVSSSAQIRVYVQARPPVPVIVMTPQPSPLYVWVNEEWETYDGTYRYAGGHWTLPPQTGYYHRSGYWQHTSKGQRWVQGKWYKKQPANNGKHKGQYKAKHKGKQKGRH